MYINLTKKHSVMPHLKQIFSAVILVVIAELTLKHNIKGMTVSKNNILQFFITAFSNPYILLALSLIALSSIIWISILSKTDLSYAYPFISAGYVAVTILSVFILNESLPLNRIIGVVIISIGIILMSRS